MKKHKKKAGTKKNKPFSMNYANPRMAAPDPTRKWENTSPEAQGFHSGRLLQLFETLPERHVRSIVIVRNGFVVAEASDNEVSIEAPQLAYSLTKSILSALVGIAISEKKLHLDQKLSYWFPQLAGEAKGEIMIRHLLTMTSGLEWYDWDNSSSEQMMYSSDWIEAVLKHPVACEPGSRFNYSNGDTHLLAVILEMAIGLPLLEYAQTKLFKPLGISDVEWAVDPQNHHIGSWGTKLTVHDMAKMYQHGGTWNGRTIIPFQWINESLTPKTGTYSADGSLLLYGNLWWMRALKNVPFKTYYACGAFGQRIYVVPDLKLIVAMTAHSSDVNMPDLVLEGVIQSIMLNSGTISRIV
ncbi:serine hydrolase domain-containing protein [Paenibacillus cremeus]|nr:serine hydrolase [Paenibacillus cremeus]